MSAEQTSYEKGWGYCARCRCRRPEKELKTHEQVQHCADKAWCDRAVVPMLKTALHIPDPPTNLEHAGELVADLEAARGKG